MPAASKSLTKRNAPSLYHCGYKSKVCTNLRARKRDGKLHRFCEDHRRKANATQKRWAMRRQQAQGEEMDMDTVRSVLLEGSMECLATLLSMSERQQHTMQDQSVFSWLEDQLPMYMESDIRMPMHHNMELVVPADRILEEQGELVLYYEL